MTEQTICNQTVIILEGKVTADGGVRMAPGRMKPIESSTISHCLTYGGGL